MFDLVVPGDAYRLLCGTHVFYAPPSDDGFFFTRAGVVGIICIAKVCTNV